MDILICCRRNHMEKRTSELPLEIHVEQVQNDYEIITKQGSKEFFETIQTVDKEGIRRFEEDEGFEMKLAKEYPSDKQAFHFLAEIENDEIESVEDFKETFHILLDAGCQINSTDRFGNTPLMLAAEKGNTIALTSLLDNGAETEKTNDDGNGPLHWASKRGRIEAIDILLLYGANINAQNKDSQTPLHLAVIENRKNVVKYLIDSNADTNWKDLKNDKTPMQYSLSKSMENLFENSNKSRNDKKNKKISSSNEHVDDVAESGSEEYHLEYLALYKDIDLRVIDPLEAANILSKKLDQKKHCMQNPPRDALQKCRYFCSQFKKVERKDVIKELRKYVPAGMTGPLVYSNYGLVSTMNRRVRQELTHSLCGQEKWKLLANELGISSNNFGYYDRKDDPAEAILNAVCVSRDLTIGELYNALVECDAGGLADQYL